MALNNLNMIGNLVKNNTHTALNNLGNLIGPNNQVLNTIQNGLINNTNSVLTNLNNIGNLFKNGTNTFFNSLNALNLG